MKNLIKQILTRMIFQTSVVGNHDDDNATNNFFDADYVYGYLLAAEETSDMVWGEEDIYIEFCIGGHTHCDYDAIPLPVFRSFLWKLTAIMFVPVWNVRSFPPVNAP